ncbi:MAG: exo-alpha-sialidase [Candidatus Methylomirabilis oxyfera]|nr:exo-alpha-sialidase [Candidatus Methylomirabilis oxyfera]
MNRKLDSSRTAKTGPVALLIGSRKGAFILRGDKSRRTWKLSAPILLGNIVHHLVLDPRDGRTMLMAVRTGHLGPTIFRSTDIGKNWKEARRPPAFPRAAEGQKGLVVDHVFWLSPGHPSEKGIWYAGSSPPGLFRSDDGGVTWEGVAGFNQHPMRSSWVGEGQQGPPDGATLHSILIDPRDPNHIYLGISAGGFFESLDGGADWKPLNKGCRADFIPTPDPEYGHDPHCVRLHPLMPDRLYHQNHCGLYRMERPEGRWVRIGDNMPKRVGDIGFPLVLHPRDPDTAWVFPMDGTTVWPRVSPDGKPAAYVTRNAGRTWMRQDAGLPKSQAWFTVKRQAMAADTHEPVGIYFGTTSGEIWGSRNEGEKWTCLASHLPEIYSVEVAELSR